MEKKSNKKRIIWTVIGVILLLAAVGCGVMLAMNLRGWDKGLDELRPSGDIVDISTLPVETETEAQTTERVTEESAYIPPHDPVESGKDTMETVEFEEEVTTDSNVVNFDALWRINPDIHAWIQVPGTAIDYPVLQSDLTDDYYVRRNYKGNYSVAGCIFTQYYNHKDFSDPNTILYGHYLANGTYFGGLHNYRDPNFFNQYRYIYVAIPGHVYIYDIFAAYEYDDRHILASYDFGNRMEYEKYLQECLNPASMSRNVREGIQLCADDKIITLSTCLSETDSSRRYLVQGVLIQDVITE